jgi:thiopeptide-type bacteriocin biosynthesis protein
VKEQKPPPISLAVTASVAATSAEAATQGQFKILMQVSPNGANLLGRFCHADPKMRAFVEEYLRQEEALFPDEVFAEIVHLPPGRVGNVICRPRLRPYEIPYLGSSSAEKEAQIPVQDLMVSVQEGRVRLRSKRLGRYIVPRMANAHNFAGADVGLYRFLCLLRNDVNPIGWHWGSLRSAPFLPRVSYGKLVLDVATWQIHASELTPLRTAKGDQIFLEAKKLRKLRRLPRRLLQYDNMLPVDFDNVLSIEAFSALLKEGAGIEMREVFPGYDEVLCEGAEGHFTHELVVPFLVPPPTPPPQPKVQERAIISPMASVPRSFAPGSRWLYAKLYTGTATADEVLTRVVRPVVALAKQAGAERWFFIRYGDPDWHLRLRIEGEPSLLWQHIAPALYQHVTPLLEGGQVWRMQLDTYEREVERYGGPVGMAISERIFEADSEATLGIVGLLSGDEGNDARWRFVLSGMDLLLDALGLSLPEKCLLLQTIRRNFATEFHTTAFLERQLDAKYRAERQNLTSLWEASEESHPLAPGLALLRSRSAQLMPLAEELRDAARQGQLTVTMSALAASYLHMHANRLLRGAARAQELVLYDF